MLPLGMNWIGFYGRSASHMLLGASRGSIEFHTSIRKFHHTTYLWTTRLLEILIELSERLEENSSPPKNPKKDHG